MALTHLLSLSLAPAAYATITTFWTCLSFFALGTSAYRVWQFATRGDESTALQVLTVMSTNMNWSTANRLITSLWFTVLGALVLTAIPGHPINVNLVGFAFIFGIVAINGLIIVSNLFDFKRWATMRVAVVSIYARDVDHGIQDAMRRLRELGYAGGGQ